MDTQLRSDPCIIKMTGWLLGPQLPDQTCTAQVFKIRSLHSRVGVAGITLKSFNTNVVISTLCQRLQFHWCDASGAMVAGVPATCRIPIKHWCRYFEVCILVVIHPSQQKKKQTYRKQFTQCLDIYRRGRNVLIKLNYVSNHTPA